MVLGGPYLILRNSTEGKVVSKSYTDVQYILSGEMWMRNLAICKMTGVKIHIIQQLDELVKTCMQMEIELCRGSVFY